MKSRCPTSCARSASDSGQDREPISPSRHLFNGFADGLCSLETDRGIRSSAIFIGIQGQLYVNESIRSHGPLAEYPAIDRHNPRKRSAILMAGQEGIGYAGRSMDLSAKASA